MSTSKKKAKKREKVKKVLTPLQIENEAQRKKIRNEMLRIGKKVVKDPEGFKRDNPKTWAEAEAYQSGVTKEELELLKYEENTISEEEVRRLNKLNQYPSPNLNKIFKFNWDIFVPELASKPNFSPIQLRTLQVLCQCFVDEAFLLRFIQENGYTYKTVGQSGIQRKPYPEVQLLNKVRDDIRNYMHALKLHPEKMAPSKDPKPDPEDDEKWD